MNESYLRAQRQYDLQTPDESDFDLFIERNESELMELWDTYKFEKYEGEYFHHDDVDYFNEDLFVDMCELVYEGKLSL